MNKALAIKISVILLIAILLNIPLSMISSKTDERNHHRHQAHTAIAKSWTDSQKVIGPILTIPYTLEKTKSVWDEKLEAYKDVTTKHHRTLWANMNTLHVESNIINDVRYKGIYEVPVYTSQLVFSGTIGKTILEDLKRKHPNITHIGRPTLSVNLSDPRGINSIPSLNINQQTLNFKPGSHLSFDPSGLHVKLDAKMLEKNQAFEFALELRGMDTLSFVPTALDASINMQSDWKHPSFIGDFLPSKRQIGEEGYTAQWGVTSFATNIEDKLTHCFKGDCTRLIHSNFGVKHIEPVDVYLQSERSVKYGFLFIALSFVTFFLFEILKKMSIHSIQYAMVGFAVSIFYLLLLALSEHINFSLSYLIATIACVGLIHVYLSSILKSNKHALAFSTVFMTLYGILFLIIKSEDFALLMGSILTFMALSIMMISTRNIDWYAVGEQLSKSTASKKAPSKSKDDSLLI